MCHFLSALVLRNGDVLHHPMLDSHSDLVTYFKLPDSNAHIQHFVKVELRPTPKTWLQPDRWTFAVDEEIAPVWWPDVAERAELAVRSIAQRMILTEGEIPLLCDGCWILGGTVKVAVVKGAARVVAMWDSASIRNVGDSASIREVGDSASIRDVWGSASIQNVWGSASIRDVGGSASIQNVWDSASIQNVGGLASIQNVGDSASIQNVWDSASIRNVGGSASIQNVWDSASIQNVGGSAKLDDSAKAHLVQLITESLK